MPRLAPQARRERRRKLIDAGWRCVAAKGYRNLTVDEVCSEAELSKGSFYTYFAGKHELLTALLDDDVARIDALMDELSAEAPRGPDRIARLLEALMADPGEPGRAQLRADLWAEVSSDAALRARLADGLRHRRALLAGWVDEAVAQGELLGLPANAFASILLALADGLMVHAAMDPGSFRWENVERAVAVMLAGLRAP
jgi:AcrR family transcriptional regulator